MTVSDLTKTLFSYWVVRLVVGVGVTGWALLLLRLSPYRAITNLCWVYRVSRIGFLKVFAYRVITRHVFDRSAGDGRLMNEFLASDAARAAADRILKRRAPFDSIFRDIMVLKAPVNGEKGVIVLEYTIRFDLFVAMYDIDKVFRDYYVVLEPCWAGYCDPSILMFVTGKADIVVQCPEQTDLDFITGLNCNLKPMMLGSSDWIDSDLFSPPDNVTKPYDLVMVANWGKHKNHRKLFAALERVKRPISLLLIGGDNAGRTAADIRAEMAEYALPHVTLEIKEGIPAREVAGYLARSKVFLLLSEKEGSNRAIVEALFANTPAILYENFIGGAKGKVNAQTGMLSSFERLHEAIIKMLDEHERFQPRAWALQNTGSKNATRKLNALLAEIARSRNEPWEVPIVEKVNNPNFNYKASDSLPLSQQARGITGAYLRPQVRAELVRSEPQVLEPVTS
jgi:glycosyltransferase involved in cell wall biosynthesis